MKQVAHLVSDELDQTVLIELRGERLGDAIDGDQLRGTLADFVLALIDDQVGVRIVESDGGIRGEILEQADVLFRIGVLLEALNAEHAEHALLRDERQIDHRGRRLRCAAVFQSPARMFVRRECISRIRSQRR